MSVKINFADILSAIEFFSPRALWIICKRIIWDESFFYVVGPLSDTVCYQLFLMMNEFIKEVSKDIFSAKPFVIALRRSSGKFKVFIPNFY